MYTQDYSWLRLHIDEYVRLYVLTGTISGL